VADDAQDDLVIEMAALLREARPMMEDKCCHFDWCIERRGVVTENSAEGFREIIDGMHPGCAPYFLSDAPAGSSFPELAGGRHGSPTGGPSSALTLDDTKLPTPPDRTRRRSTKGHPRLWVIRCSGPAGQLPLPEPAPIHSLNRVHSGAGPQRRSLSRARSPADMRHR
jgi:hypothetical protein